MRGIGQKKSKQSILNVSRYKTANYTSGSVDLKELLFKFDVKYAQIEGSRP